MDIDKPLISQAEWAREQGVSKQYVSKLVKAGKIVLVDGKVDREDAARRLTARQDLLKRAKKSTELTGSAFTRTEELTDMEPRLTIGSAFTRTEDLTSQAPGEFDGV